MYTAFLYGTLLMLSFAMLLFVVGFLCYRLHSNLLSGIFYSVADNILLAAFGVLLVLAVIAILISIYQQLRRYFAPEAIALRRVLTTHAKKNQQMQMLAPVYRQIQYQTLIKRQRLLVADNRKQIRALYSAISQELKLMRTQLSDDKYRYLDRSLRQYHKRADAEAMLALRERIICR